MRMSRVIAAIEKDARAADVAPPPRRVSPPGLAQAPRSARCRTPLQRAQHATVKPDFGYVALELRYPAGAVRDRPFDGWRERAIRRRCRDRGCVRCRRWEPRMAACGDRGGGRSVTALGKWAQRLPFRPGAIPGSSDPSGVTGEVAAIPSQHGA
jgi:hypothetical protein